jgi:hypothetical protein
MVNKKWEMFERVVAAIHVAEQKGATVRWNEAIRGRQFDVTVRFKHGLYEYLTVVECKDYATAVPAEKVDALVTKSRDVGADKAILVASSGFQSGAIEVAKKHGIQLFSLKSLADSQKTVADALLPVLWVYDFRFRVRGQKVELAIPEEPGVLRMFLRDMKIEGPTINTTAEEILEKARQQITRSATPVTQQFVVEFPEGTDVIHPNLGNRTPIESFRVMYQLISAGDLKSTGELGIDPYLDGSIYKLANEITSDTIMIDSSKLKLGFDTKLEVGKYYRNPKLGFSYYCIRVRDDDADLVLVESYQYGRLIQATGHGHPREWWSQFVEITDKQEVERLTRLYEQYQKNTSKDS